MKTRCDIRRFPNLRQLLFIPVLLIVIVVSGCNELDEAEDAASGESRVAEQSAGLTVVSYGGTYQAAQRVSMFEPYSKKNGTILREGDYEGEFDEVVDSLKGGADWDVVDVEGNTLFIGGQEGFFEPIDYTVVPKEGLLENAVTEYGVGVMSYSYVLAYKSDVIQPEQVVNPWKVLFDAKGIPGPRGLHHDPRRTLEIALMAGGVAPDKLYPLDVDRAFAFLTKFRNAMKVAGMPIVWWHNYEEPQRLLTSGKVILTPGLNGRLFAAKGQGEPIGMTWKNGIMDFDWWVVPKGTKHYDEAMKFIAYAVSPEAQAALPRAIAYGPINEKAWGMISDSIKKELPTFPENREVQTWINTEWWVANLDDVQKRWDAWMAEGK